MRRRRDARGYSLRRPSVWAWRTLGSLTTATAATTAAAAAAAATAAAAPDAVAVGTGLLDQLQRATPPAGDRLRRVGQPADNVIDAAAAARATNSAKVA